MLNVGRNVAYALMNSDCFPSIQIGKKWYVAEGSLRSWLKDNEYSKIKLD
jgi:hypothetical protein